MAIKSIKINGKNIEADIDFSKIYGTSAEAMNKNRTTDNAIKNIHQEYWGDNSELSFDPETGLVKEGNTGLGFINPEDIHEIDTTVNENPSTSQSRYNGS